MPPSSEQGIIDCGALHTNSLRKLLKNLYEYQTGKYGAPFVTSILLLTEANFVQQKSLLSDKSNFVYDKSNFVYDKITFVYDKMTFVRQKLISSDKIIFFYDKITFVWQKQFCLDKNCFCQQK